LAFLDKISDIGAVDITGSVEYKGRNGTFTFTGSGENVYSAQGDFQFVRKQAMIND
jgi:hypothetical protein